MATTITTTTAASATRGGRHIGVTSAGTVWAMHYDLFNTRMEFWYSTDKGSSWTEATSLRVTLAADRAEQHEFYIGEHDRAAFASCGSGGYVIQYVPELTTSATWTVLSSNTTQDTDSIRVKVLDYGSLSGVQTYVILAFEANNGGEGDWWSYQRKVSDDSAVSEQRVEFATGCDQIDFDFQHNGDGKTAVTNPAIWVTWRNIDSNRTYVERRVWNNTQRGWSTTKSPRIVSSEAAVDTDALSCLWDGTRFISCFFNSSTTTFPRWAERDSGDTATTYRTVPTMADGDIEAISLARDSAGDTRLYAIGATSDDVRRITYDRTAGSFGSWELIAATTGRPTTLSVQAGRESDGVSLLWTGNSSSPYDVEHDRDLFNLAPLAPPWVSPATGSAHDITASLVLDWSFDDPDEGDTMSAYALQRSVNGAALEYFNAGAGTWGASEVKNLSGTSAVTLTTAQDGFTVDGDVVIFKVRTWDASDEPGPYGSALSLTGSTPVSPTITSPTDSATITSNTIGTVTWTATAQTAFRGRLLTSSDVVLTDSGKVTTDVKEWAPSHILTNGLTGAKVEIRVWNDDDLEGPTDTHTFDVTFVAPADPTAVVVAESADGRIKVTVTHPTPTGSQPDVVSIDLDVRVAAGGSAVGERPVGGDGIRIIAESVDATVYDYQAAVGVPFEYRVRANGDNGTSSVSAWT